MRRLPELDQITAFLAVAEELSFRRAAERLALDQSALSRRIKDLEWRVDCQLLVRTTHAVRLTDAGRVFYEANQRLIGDLGQAVERAQRTASGISGRLAIGYMSFAAIDLMPRASRQFADANPEVALSFVYERTEAQKLSLARGEIDIGLMLGPFEHSDFETITVARESLIAAMPDGHALASSEVVSLAAVAEHGLVIGSNAQWDFYRSIIGGLIALTGSAQRIVAEASSLTGILGLVRAGFGVTLVPEGMRGFLPPGIVARPVQGGEDSIETVAAWRTPADAKVAAFVACLEAVRPPRQATGTPAKRRRAR